MLFLGDRNVGTDWRTKRPTYGAGWSCWCAGGESLIGNYSLNHYYFISNQKLNHHYARGITRKRVTSGGVHLRGLAPGQRNSEKMSQRQRAVGGPVSYLIGPGIEPRPPPI